MTPLDSVTHPDECIGLNEDLLKKGSMTGGICRDLLNAMNKAHIELRMGEAWRLDFIGLGFCFTQPQSYSNCLGKFRGIFLGLNVVMRAQR